MAPPPLVTQPSGPMWTGIVAVLACVGAVQLAIQVSAAHRWVCDELRAWWHKQSTRTRNVWTQTPTTGVEGHFTQRAVGARHSWVCK